MSISDANEMPLFDIQKLHYKSYDSKHCKQFFAIEQFLKIQVKYDPFWSDVIWYEPIWNDTIWYRMIWFGKVKYGIVWYNTICYSTIRYNIQYDPILLKLS